MSTGNPNQNQVFVPSRRLRFGSLALGACLALTSFSSAALAQDAGHEGPSPEEVKEKIVEIEKLMKDSEQLLAGAIDSRDPSKRSAELIKKLINEKAGGEDAADEMRKLAEQGSKEAQEKIAKLTEEATQEATRRMKKLLESTGGASGGIKKMLDSGRDQSDETGKKIEWILDNVKSSGGGSGKKKKPKPKDEKEKQQEKEKPKPQSHRLDQPQSPQFDAWLAELPPQVRKAYESRDWDSIPPRWRHILRAWTKKMAEKLEKDR